MKLSNILKVLDRVVNIKLNNNRNIDKKHTYQIRGALMMKKTLKKPF